MYKLESKFIFLTLVVCLSGCTQRIMPEKIYIPNRRLEMSPQMKEIVIELVYMKLDPNEYREPDPFRKQ